MPCLPISAYHQFADKKARDDRKARDLADQQRQQLQREANAKARELADQYRQQFRHDALTLRTADGTYIGPPAGGASSPSKRNRAKKHSQSKHPQFPPPETLLPPYSRDFVDPER
jgi:hypothetical protein